MWIYKDRLHLHLLKSLRRVEYCDGKNVSFIDLWIIDVSQVGKETLNPILFLLQSHDVEVQRPASAALANLAVNSKS